MKNIIKRYKSTVLMIGVLILMNIVVPDKGEEATSITMSNSSEMLKVIPPIFILLGLLDVWIPREKMIKYMGDNSGIIGILITFLLGSVATGPLYAALPMAGTLLKKVLIYIYR